MKEKEKRTPHIVAVTALAVFIVLGLACASSPATSSNIKKDLSVGTAVYSKDGKFLITGGKRKAVISVFDISTGKRVKKYNLKKNRGIGYFLLSDDGRTLLLEVTGDRSVLGITSVGENLPTFGYIYDIESNTILHILDRQGVYFSGPDGFRTVSGTHSTDGSVKISISDTISGAVIKEITMPGMLIEFFRDGRFSISQDGRYFALINRRSDETMWVIHTVDLEDPDLKVSFTTSDLTELERLNSVAFSPDGMYMALGFTRGVFPRAELSARIARAERAVNQYRHLSADAAINAAYREGFDIEKSEYNRRSVVTIINLSTGGTAGVAVQ